MSNLLIAIRALELHKLQASRLVAALEGTSTRLPTIPRSAPNAYGRGAGETIRPEIPSDG